jgi:two-component system, OmpR family, sensor histidine kinase KdpD
MNDDQRPNPDILLHALKQAELSVRKGKLSIFFGMAAGVGKTYAMLEAAQNQFKDGVDVTVGIVESHGRTETESLLKGLPLIPRKKISYRDTVIEEIDIDVVLSRHPSLVLVDELAHTNAPGSRHEKRWQDVLEILDAGIDVYTTLNVQHVESRKENVEGITGVTIRETVPDSVFERAAQIELVDISPNDLLRRLSEGKVYFGDMARRAIDAFFKEDHLTALREIALRLTAEKVESDLQSLLALRGRVYGWRSTERLMVAISHSPTSESLIRTTRRIAFSLDATWIAVYVDTGAVLSEQDKTQLAKNLTLVRELGGEIASTADTDLAKALLRIAEQRNITQVIFGRPTHSWLKNIFSSGTPLDRLVRESGNFDVLVLRHEKPIQKKRRRVFNIMPESGILSYWYILWIIAAISLLDSLINPIIGYRAVGFVFLLSILIISLFVSLGPILFAALLSTFIWDYFFIPPVGKFTIRAPEDVIMGIAYFVVAMVTGTLTHRIRKREQMLRHREERTEILYEIVKAIAGSSNKECFIDVSVNRVGTIFNAECAVMLGGSAGNLALVNTPGKRWVSSENDMAVAKYAFTNGRVAGWSTDTLPLSDSLYLPLIGSSSTVGVFIFHPRVKLRLLPEESNFLNTVVRQLAIGIERENLNEKSLQARQLQESERLHQTILDSISHEIRTPLTAIMGASSALQDKKINEDTESRNELTDDLLDASERLNNVVENLLDTSRLNSGVLKLKLEWCDPKDLISITLEKLNKILKVYKVNVNITENLPLLFIDFQLFEQVLSNLIRNAAIVTPANGEITIEVKPIADLFEIAVLDSGPGIPEDAMKNVFERFYRVPGTPVGGLGLGLWLSRNIVELHGGKVSVRNRPSGGAAFTISLPLRPQPVSPPEEINGSNN